MPVVEQKPGAMTQPSQGIAPEKRISTRAIATPAEDEDKLYWIEMKKQYPYQPDHQVELLHLQAEADALLLKLQAKEQRQINDQAASELRAAT